MATKRGRHVCPACLEQKRCVTLERVYSRPQGSSLIPRGWMCPECGAFYQVPPDEQEQKEKEM